MKVEFVGVGEAFDETQGNNSQILEWPECRLLIDCGYAVPHALWRVHPEPEYIDAVYLSHRHADHYFGLPSYLIRLAEDGRKRPITIVCPDGNEKVILEMIEYAYQGITAHLGFAVDFVEVSPHEPLEFSGATLQFAPSSHPVKNFAICVSYQGRRYAYSGDGNFTEHTRRLYRECSLVVHEAYSMQEPIHGHAAIQDLLKMAAEEKIQKLALTHLNRHLRKTKRAEIEEAVRASGLNVIIPETGEIYEV
jgi:ribonuclease BN (tRNA processing enzyme)